MVLQLAGVHLVLRVVGGILVHVGHQDRLRVGRFDVLPGASVAMSAGTDLVVKGAVDFVLLRTEDRGEIVSHGGRCECARVRSVGGESRRAGVNERRGIRRATLKDKVVIEMGDGREVKVGVRRMTRWSSRSLKILESSTVAELLTNGWLVLIPQALATVPAFASSG